MTTIAPPLIICTLVFLLLSCHGTKTPLHHTSLRDITPSNNKENNVAGEEVIINRKTDVIVGINWYAVKQTQEQNIYMTKEGNSLFRKIQREKHWSLFLRRQMEKAVIKFSSYQKISTRKNFIFIIQIRSATTATATALIYFNM